MKIQHKSLRAVLGLAAIIKEQQVCYLCSCSSPKPLCLYCRSEIARFDLQATDYNLMMAPQIFKALPKLKNHQVLSIGWHSWPLDHLISSVKYSDKIMLIKEIANVFNEHCIQPQNRQQLPQAIVATPMHPLRMMLRGFNQSALILENLGKTSQIKVLKSALCRTSFARPQVMKSGTDRRKLARLKFRADPVLKHYDHIALFDDVITTGSTMLAMVNAITAVNPVIRIDLWSASISLPRR